MTLEQLQALGAAGPTVTPAPWKYSASQLKTYHDCARKWYFAKVLGYPEPTSPAAQLGQKLHAEVEAWFQDGTEPPSLEARLLLDGLPERSDDLVVEGQAQIRVYPDRRDGPRFQGYVDLIEPGEVVTIWDHKTTGSLRWAKSEYELKQDIQMISYAHFYFLADGEAREVDVAHNYVTTKGYPERRIVRARLSRKHVRERWAELVALIETMETTRALGDVRKVRKTESACNKYGGCPHRENCARASFGRPVPMFNPPDAPKPETPDDDAPPVSDALALLRAKVGTPKPDPIPAEFEPFGFSTRALRALAEIGAVTEADLRRVDFKRLEGLKGIGAKTIEEIRDQVEGLAEVETPIAATPPAPPTPKPEPPAAPPKTPQALPVAPAFFEGAASQAGAVDFEGVVEWARALGLKLTIEIE